MKGGRRWFLWAALAYPVIIAAVTFGLFNLYDGSRSILDEAMAKGSWGWPARACASFTRATGV